MKKRTRLLTLIVMAAGLVFVTACKSDSGKDDKSKSAQAKSEKSKKDKGSKQKSELPIEATGPVATVDGKDIPAEEFNEVAKRRLKRFGSNLPPQMVGRYKTQILEGVINKRILDNFLADKDIEVTDKDLKDRIKEFKERFPSDKEFQNFLKENDLSEKEFKGDLKKDLALKKYVRNEYGIEITDKKIKEYYNKNKKQYNKKERVSASHILIKSGKKSDKSDKEAKKQAEKLAKEARKKDTDFSKLAKEKSEGPSASKGGKLPEFSKKDMVPEFSKAAFNMKPGEVSDPVKTKFGYHVIKVHEKKDARTVPLKEAKGDIRKKLEQREFRSAMQKFMKKVKKDVKIKKNPDNIKVNVKSPKGGKGKGGPGGMNIKKLNPKQLKKKLKQKAKQKQQGSEQGKSGSDKGSN